MSCTHTDAGDNTARNTNGSPHGPAWWQVDLGEVSIVQHVDLWHRTDCCQDRLEEAGVYVSSTPDYTTGVLCGRLSDHTQTPEVAQCGSITGRYVTIAHDREHGGTSNVDTQAITNTTVCIFTDASNMLRVVAGHRCNPLRSEGLRHSWCSRHCELQVYAPLRTGLSQHGRPLLRRH